MRPGHSAPGLVKIGLMVSVRLWENVNAGVPQGLILDPLMFSNLVQNYLLMIPLYFLLYLIVILP